MKSIDKVNHRYSKKCRNPFFCFRPFFKVIFQSKSYQYNLFRDCIFYTIDRNGRTMMKIKYKMLAHKLIGRYQSWWRITLCEMSFLLSFFCKIVTQILCVYGKEENKKNCSGTNVVQVLLGQYLSTSLTILQSHYNHPFQKGSNERGTKTFPLNEC